MNKQRESQNNVPFGRWPWFPYVLLLQAEANAQTADQGGAVQIGFERNAKMPEPEIPNPYAAPAEADGIAADWKPASVFWTVPGGACGAVIGAILIGRPDELFRGNSLLFLIPAALLWGFLGLVGSLVWRLPRYLLWGRIRTPIIARIASGAMLFVSCILVLQMGRTRVIDLPEPAMGITMISMLLACVVCCVQFEVWYGRRMG